MKRDMFTDFVIFTFTLSVLLISGCGNKTGRDSGKLLRTEDVQDNGVGGGNGSASNQGNDGSSGNNTGGTGSTDGNANAGGNSPGSGGGSSDPDGGTPGLHPVFRGKLGVPVPRFSIGAIDPDPTGHNLCDDYDGDGIPNNHEVISNPFVADYARIVTRISPPITMEIRVSRTSLSENHTETIDDTNVLNTIQNSMESRQYTQANRKTTPYVAKESYSNSESHSEAYGSSDSYSVGGSSQMNFSGFGGGGSFNYSKTESNNESVSNAFARSSMSEKTVFQDVDYVDNLDRNGIEFKNDTVQKISQNYRKSRILKETDKIGPNDGYVRASLFIKNLTVNIPVRISNVICTLSFRTPVGEYLPVKTFKLRNEDYSEFVQEVYGDEELGPYTVEISDLNTNEVMKALRNGYVPQVHIVNYDLRRVQDSAYNPGVDNLKIVEETAKGRTALIKIVGENTREIFRVAAFDVNDRGDIVPGISLKKALFNIFRGRIGSGEQWIDSELTVADAGLKWKTGNKEHVFNTDKKGNSWDMFETYIKTYTDEFNTVHAVEAVKRIGSLKKYNPFDLVDNPSYNPNELLGIEEINKMKYWLIYHNGRYFEGDVNDPIWAGERYELVCIDIRDFNDHFKNYYYTPVQSGEPIILNTRWNRLSQDDYMKRARYIGKIIKGDVIHLEIDLLQSKFLFNPELISTPMGNPVLESGRFLWTDNIFNYTFEPARALEKGIPGKFIHAVSGGFNNMIVEIQESQFAREYEIMMGPLNAPESAWKTIRITADDLYDKGNKVIISRNTLDISGNPVGFLSGGQTYETCVKALGNAYGYTVHTSSMTNGTAQSRSIIQNVSPGVTPGSFTFKSTGGLNSIDVRIQDGLNIEYYVVEYQGPYNYSNAGGLPPMNTVIGRPGINRIFIDNPAGEINDPGLYRITVYAVNSNVVSGLRSGSGEEYILVNFERYKEQKKFSAAVSGGYSDLTAIDLEVNFNDGKGWYSLNLAGNDTGRKYIDCRFTSYYEQDRQKFHVFFRPPSGTSGLLNPSPDDVFSGGREEADLYIRTVAENRFRDTFWPRRSESEDYSISTGTGVVDFIKFWIGSSFSDASLVEETIKGIHQGPFTLSGSTIDKYFFSPLEYRAYSIKTILTDTISAADTSSIDEPTFSVSEGNNVIQVNDFSSLYGNSYRVCWLQVDGYSQEQINNLAGDILLAGWSCSVELLSVSLGNPGGPENYYRITGIIPNNNYAVAVRSVNMYGKVSRPVFIKSGSDVRVFSPLSYDPPARIAGLSLGLGTDGRSIRASNIYVPNPNIDFYELKWKSSSGNSSGSIQIPGDGINPASHLIENLNYWDRYTLQARARVKRTLVWGEWSDPVMIETVTDPGFSGGLTTQWVSTDFLNNSTAYYCYSALRAAIMYPLGTVKVEANWSLGGIRSISEQVTIDSSSIEIEIFPYQEIAYSDYCSNSGAGSANHFEDAVLHVAVKATNMFGEDVLYEKSAKIGNWKKRQNCYSWDWYLDMNY